MNEINVYIGGQIRKYRKANGMTLQRSPFFRLSGCISIFMTAAITV